MCGAVSAGRLLNVALPTVALTMTGTLPAPASEAGSSTMIWSKPGVSDGPVEMMDAPDKVVVPIVTVTVAVCPEGGRRPVTMMSRRVGAVSVSVEVQLPVVPESFGLVVVTANGSPVGAMQGFVTFRTAARPPGPFVEVKMSGSTGLMRTDVRMRAPMLKTVTGCAVEVLASPTGTTKLIWFAETK